MQYMRFIGLMFFVSFLGVGCAKNPATGKMDFNLVSQEELEATGRVSVQSEIKQFGLYKEKKDLERYYKNLTAEILAISDIPESGTEFVLIDSEIFNAWATPGYINTYRGILPFLKSESELVGLLGHEIGHLSARHTAKSISIQKVENIALSVGDAVLSNFEKKLLQDSHLIEHLHKIGAGVYGQRKEAEADSLGIRYLERMGYDPREFAGVFKTFDIYDDYMRDTYKYLNYGKEPEKKTMYYDLIKSHPDPEDRYNKLISLVGELPSDYKLAGDDRYLRMIDGIAYGPNFRKFGAAGKDVIYLPKAQAKLQLPKGFLIRHNGLNWHGYNKERDLHFTLETASLDSGEYMEEVMRKAYPKIKNFKEFETKSGLTVVTGSITHGYKFFGKKNFESIERVIGVKGASSLDAQHTKKEFFVLSYSMTKKREKKKDEPTFEEIEAAFLKQEDELIKSIEGFKVLSKAQARRLQPLRVRIYTVKKGDTVASLARKMPFSVLAEQHFKTLNTLYDYDKLKVGQKVKLVVDPNI